MNRNFFTSNCKQRINLHFAIPNNQSCCSYRLFIPLPPSILVQVLCVHLKRLRFDAYFSSKISRHIAFPLNDLDMGPYLKDCEWNNHSLFLPCTVKKLRIVCVCVCVYIAARAGQNCNYELCAVITHYGGAGGKLLNLLSRY